MFLVNIDQAEHAYMFIFTTPDPNAPRHDPKQSQPQAPKLTTPLPQLSMASQHPPHTHTDSSTAHFDCP